MDVLYLDLFSGISGDMLLGALFDLGADPARVETELRKLPLGPWHWHVHRDSREHIAGCRVEVHPAPAHPDTAHGAPPHAHIHPHADAQHHEHRSFAEIRRLIEESPLAPWVRERALAWFRRIAEAEARIHGQPVETVHFHEVGAVDSIVDIVGGCIALDLLGRPRVLAGPVVDGTGWIECAHGRFPVPAPATLAILGARGVPISQCEEPHELVTPTGAAFLAEFVEEFGPMRNLVARRIGYGLGHRTLRTRPNVLRAVLGSCATAVGEPPAPHDWEHDEVAVLETNLDDTTGEQLGTFMETALQAGALDVFCVPVQMKKQRPGVWLTLLCPPGEADRFTELILRQTSALGVRRSVRERRKLRRQIVEIATAYGTVRVKVGLLDNQAVQAKPEWDDCVRCGRDRNVEPRVVWQAALAGAWPTIAQVAAAQAATERKNF